MSAPIAAAPVAAAPIAAAPVAAAPVAAAPEAAPVAAAPVAAAPVAAAPVAAAPVAAAPVAASAPVGLPAGFGGLSAPPAIGSIAGGSSSFPDEHFDKPLLFNLRGIESRPSKFTNPDGSRNMVDVPTVDYIVLNPVTGTIEEHRNVTIWTGQITKALADSFKKGERFITAVAVKKPTDKGNPMLVLDPLDDDNSGYGAKEATEYLSTAASKNFGWWTTAA